MPLNDFVSIKSYIFLLVDEWKSLEYLWNNAGKGKSKNSGDILSQCHFVCLQHHVDLPPVESWLPLWESRVFAWPWYLAEINFSSIIRDCNSAERLLK